MKLCKDCIHHRQGMNIKEHFCNLATWSKTCPVTGQQLIVKISCFQARDTNGFCKPEGIAYATK